MDVDLAREFYFRELDGKAQQDARMGVYVALISFIGGGLALLIRAAWPPDGRLCYVALGAAGAALVLYLLAIIWVIRASAGLTYEKLPSPNRLLDYRRALSSYYEENSAVPGSANEDFDDYLVRKLSSAATRNSESNLARSAHFWLAARLLLWVVVLVAVAALALGVREALAFF